MRSILLILATILLLGGAFVGYTWLSSGDPRPQQAERVSLATHGSIDPSDPDQIVGASMGVWINRYDDRAELTSRLRYAESHPRPDGLVELDKPEAEFFLDAGRVLRIEGARGSVVMQQAGDNPAQSFSAGGGAPAEPQPPSRGQLHDVVISFYESRDAHQRRAPALTVEMNNAAFDNDTFRITTDAYTDPATGHQIAADQVPVKVRSADYDFDGRGLVIRWNERDRRLQLLEIAHGERLTVKNPSALRMPLGENAAAPAREADPHVILASADPATAAEVAAAASAATDDAPATPSTTGPTTRRAGRRAPTLYRATFDRALQISQGETELATGDAMQVDFLVGSDSGGLLAPTTAPAVPVGIAAPTTATALSTTLPTTAPTGAVADVGAAPSTAPATQPAVAPIVIRWTGKLRVAPLDTQPVAPLAPGDAAVRLAGAPLRLTYNGADIECAAMTYRTADAGATFEASDAVAAVTLKDAPGSVVTTPRLDYAPASGTAVLRGPGHAAIIVAREGHADETMTAEWAEQCALRLISDGAGGTTIEQADLTGSVAVRHPQLDLDAASVSLAFAPTPTPATQPATLWTTGPARRERVAVELRRMTATGDVLCVIRDPAAPDAAGGADGAAAPSSQSIAADQLEVETARAEDGQLYPRAIRADGAVRAEGDGQSLAAGHLTALLAPTTRPADPSDADASAAPAIDLESLTASGGVRLTGRAGAFAEGDELYATGADGRTEATLRGSPARVGDGTNTLDGPAIRFVPDEGFAEVVGPGALHGVRAADRAGEAPRPFDVAWAGGVRVDARANTIDFREEITLTTIDDDGTRTTATADALRLELVDAPSDPDAALAADAAATPATTPSTRPAAPRRGGLSFAGFSGGDDDDRAGAGFLSGKQPRSATLDGNVKIESALLGPDGAVLRRAYLSGDSASYDVASRRVDVPGAGQMLVEDYRAPDPPRPGEEPALAGARGATAFKWTKSLAYDAAGRAATMEGEVFVNHKPVGQGQPFQIQTQRVRAELEEPPARPATQPLVAAANTTTQPTTSPSPAAGFDAVADGLRIKRITADGGVRVESDRFKFRATDLTYSPADDTLVARGTENDPITFTDEKGGSEGAVRELRWNTKTDRITLSKFRGQVR